MLSKKMTFSLMSLITLLAFAFVAPFATAGVLGDKFATTITLDDAAGDNVVRRRATAVSIKVVFGKAVAVGALMLMMLLIQYGLRVLCLRLDVTIVAFNKTTGVALSYCWNHYGHSNEVTLSSTTEFTVPFTGIIDDEDVVVLVTIAEGAVTNNDPADVIAAGTGDDTLGGNAKATLQFDVVAAVIRMIQDQQ